MTDRQQNHKRFIASREAMDITIGDEDTTMGVSGNNFTQDLALGQIKRLTREVRTNPGDYYADIQVYAGQPSEASKILVVEGERLSDTEITNHFHTIVGAIRDSNAETFTLMITLEP